jgi:peptide deformylase
MSDVIKFNTEEQIKERLVPEQTKLQTFQLVEETHPILRKQLKEFDFQNPPVDANLFASMMVETCRENKGFGLSANQCGFEHRMFVMGADDNYVAFFNPEVIEASKEEVLLIEGCLSFPLLGLRINRPKEITVQYQDYTGQKRFTKLDGISARCFQHELDHLNGIVYTSRAKPLALKTGIDKRNKFFKQIKKSISSNRAGQLLSTPSN